MARARWAQRPLCGSPWVFNYLYCPQMITQTHPRGNRRGSENAELWKNLLPSAMYLDERLSVSQPVS